MPGTDQWQEVLPSRVVWEVPDTISWVPAIGDLRPNLRASTTARGTVSLTASYAGKKTTLEIEVPPSGGQPATGPLRVVREPEGESIPVDTQQRYTIEQGGAPAAGVRWEDPPFENDFVRWNPPILLAKRPGHEQSLTASVGDQKISFITRTTGEPPRPVEVIEPPAEKPASVRLVSGQQQPIQLPKRSRFTDFRIQAVFPGREPQDVTSSATLKVEGDADSQAVSVSNGQIVGQRAGKAEVRAEFNGVKSEESLKFEVTDRVELTAMSVSPSSVRLNPGEEVRVTVTGYRTVNGEKQSVGDVTALPDLQWQSDHPEFVKASGPTLSALAAGKATVTVMAGSASATVEVEVGQVNERLVASPELLRLRVGESKRLGSDIKLRRGEADFSNQVEAASASPNIVRYNRESNSLEGVSPGNANVALKAGGKSVTLPVEVTGISDESGSIVIEPASGSIAAGEAIDFRVVLVNSSGQRIDRTGSAILSSSDNKVLSVAGNRVTGAAAGAAKVTARLPGNSPPAEASFEVVADQSESIEITPSRLTINVGERKTLRIEAAGKAGRRELGNVPDLRIKAREQNIVEINGTDIRGVTPGNTTLEVSWNSLTAQPVAVVVRNDPILSLRIAPQEATVAVNDREHFSVFAVRRDGEELLSPASGLSLKVNDPSVASTESDLMVRGLNQGRTAVSAELGPHRASASLTVVPPPPDGARAATGGNGDHRLPLGLNFIPNELTMQRGIPGTSVRLVRVFPGSEEDLDHEAQFEITPSQGIVSVKWTRSGPVFEAQKVGEAQVTARYEDVTTSRPLRVRVVEHNPNDPTQGRPRLEVQPDPLNIAVGELAPLRHVLLVAPGSTPNDVNFTVESQNNQIVKVESDKQLRGVSAGQAKVTIRPVGLPQAFADLKADVMVNVEKPDGGQQLVLKGPSRSTVGAPCNYRVELGGQDVTLKGAALVLDADKAHLATLQAGCVLVANEPGTLNVKARYEDRVSNALTLAVDSVPPPAQIESLELEVERRQMTVGERRPYILWGVLRGGGPKRDLTLQVRTSDGESAGNPVLRMSPKGTDTRIIAHEPAALLAKAPGQFTMQAEYGPTKSRPVDLEIVKDSEGQLSVTPREITIQVNDKTPALQALLTAPGEARGRSVDATWSSENESLVAADPQSPGRFRGKSAGKTRLVAKFGNQSAAVDVAVGGSDAFAKLDVGEFTPAGNMFTVAIAITANHAPSAPLDYRASPVGQPEGGEWKPATASGESQQIKFTSPPLRRGPDETKYHLLVEARERSSQKVIARYPLSFGLETDTRVRFGNKGTQ